ncbi:hypothetical protein LTR37_011145 [Vermiconidia calcicola]|uniref:Uncharacterized protein n=1 Tax=Vermiconidia calcicola TaxID=1690605 RepID=A0ACC3N322_9PEZI|nr:hypothetical protein LTR37_011145 [Vermiconidia calcicola]
MATEEATDGVAGAQLASIAELVEMILLSLPLSDILLAQRVDRTWKHVIDTSPQLQRALFFAPATDSTMALVGDLGSSTNVPAEPSAASAGTRSTNPSRF